MRSYIRGDRNGSKPSRTSRSVPWCLKGSIYSRKPTAYMVWINIPANFGNYLGSQSFFFFPIDFFPQLDLCFERQGVLYVEKWATQCLWCSCKKRDIYSPSAMGDRMDSSLNRRRGPAQAKPYLLIHDCGELTEHVLIMGPQLLLVLQLVLLDEPLVHI